MSVLKLISILKFNTIKYKKIKEIGLENSFFHFNKYKKKKFNTVINKIITLIFLFYLKYHYINISII